MIKHLYSYEFLFREFKECFENLSMNPDCRVVVLSAAGKAFCAGKLT